MFKIVSDASENTLIRFSDLEKRTPNGICDKKTYFSVKTLKQTKIMAGASPGIFCLSTRLGAKGSGRRPALQMFSRYQDPIGRDFTNLDRHVPFLFRVRPGVNLCGISFSRHMPRPYRTGFLY